MVKEEIGRTLAPISKPRRSSPQKERPREFYNNRYVAQTIRPHPEPRYPKQGGRRDTNEWRTTKGGENMKDKIGITNIEIGKSLEHSIIIGAAKSSTTTCQEKIDAATEAPILTLADKDNIRLLIEDPASRFAVPVRKTRRCVLFWRFLTNEQKLCRLATCEDMLEMTRTDPEWKDKIITGDETWVYGYDPETKRQSAEWRGQDNKGIVHNEYLTAGQTVFKEMSLGILRRLSALGDEFFGEKTGQKILPQPPSSPDIAPNDFFLFPKLKAVLKGRHFYTRDVIIHCVTLKMEHHEIVARKLCKFQGRRA
ncbi:hypothetical protein LAZ67_13000749 [Cordylochernes scorpioides]|uniref:Mariner Mos1 transposase n=1 Tax=Cordylochernes scorpioides TaxID=51811 RepID=A0ABY6L844_9ARAC|nr:hypothetical protein LAZ67_13000749 [Cordylochernes scorpioides]